MRKTGLIKLISLMLLALIFLPLNFAWAWAIAPDLPREPVIIVPGILGSWKKQGEWVIDPILHTYDNLYNTLKQAGYMPDMDLYTFAYDWSVSNALTAWDLKNRINEIKTANNVSLVDLVVHSMGGLVARQYIEIVSDGDAGTLNTITVEDSDDDKLWEHGEPVNYGYGDGDGTVPIHSAKGFIGDYSTVINAAHKDLPTAARQQVAVLLDEGLVIDDLGGDSELVEIDDFLFITIHSPIDVLITDSNGNQVGAGGDTNNQIQGAFYSGEDDPEFITIPNPISGDYTIKVFGTGHGEYEIKISYLNNNGEEEVKVITGIASPGEIYYHTINLDNCQLFQAAVSDNPNPFGFNDTETSSGNTYSAGTLDFLVSSAADFSPNITPTATSSRDISVLNDGILGFQYTASTTNFSGELCDYLDLSAKLDGNFATSSSLKNFFYNANEYTATEDWQFTAILTNNNPALQNKTCAFDFVFNGTQIGGAGFSDQEIISNTVASGNWTITPPPSPQFGDVVINEVMWMGSTVSTADEWIELRNMTSVVINIGGWKIEKTTTSGGTLTIPAGKTIAANGYFLITNYDKTNSSSTLNVSPDWVENDISLGNDSNDNLLLKTSSGILIDSAKGTPWPAGCNNYLSCIGLRQSMERNDTPGDGTQTGSWHTCTDSICNDTTYWDSEGNNYGTPGHANLSKNDPTAEDYNLNENILDTPAEVAEEMPAVEETNIEEQPTDEEKMPIEIQDEPVAGGDNEQAPAVEEQPVIIEEPTTVEQPAPEPPPAGEPEGELVIKELKN